MVYWVIVRSLTTGEILARHAFKTHREAIAKIRELEEAPDPEGHVCKVEIQTLWHRRLRSKADAPIFQAASNNS